jgi:hypothetical protein
MSHPTGEEADLVIPKNHTTIATMAIAAKIPIHPLASKSKPGL